MIVLEIQKRLHQLGYSVGALDGVMGRRTRNAIKTFQRANGLEVDGVVGPNTQRVLFANVPKKDFTDIPWMTEAYKVKGLHERRDRWKLWRWLKSGGGTVGDPSKIPWCFSPDTEILTADGFQSIANITSSSVYQVDDRGRLSLTNSFQKVETDNIGNAYQFEGITCSTNHRFWGKWIDGDNEEERFGTLDYLISDIKRTLKIPNPHSENIDSDSNLDFTEYDPNNNGLITRLSREEAIAVIDQYGTHNQINTQDYNLIKQFEHVGVLAGYNVIENGIGVVFTDKCKELHQNDITVVDYTGKLYCVTVPMGRIVIKTHNGTMVTGNCGDYVETAIARSLPNEKLPTNPYLALNWANFGEPVKPQYGSILSFWRGNPSSWKGHVGFYAGETQTHYKVLGGNQSNAVTESLISKKRLRENGSRWPLSGPDPSNKRVYTKAGRLKVTTNEE